MEDNKECGLDRCRIYLGLFLFDVVFLYVVGFVVGVWFYDGFVWLSKFLDKLWM